MTIQEINQKFQVEPMNGMPCIVLQDDSSGVYFVSVSSLLDLFGSVDATYAALSATPQASAGWQKYFDAWKAAGIIS